jgi:hypothetical protein
VLSAVRAFDLSLSLHARTQALSPPPLFHPFSSYPFVPTNVPPGQMIAEWCALHFFFFSCSICLFLPVVSRFPPPSSPPLRSDLVALAPASFAAFATTHCLHHCRLRSCSRTACNSNRSRRETGTAHTNVGEHGPGRRRCTLHSAC